MFSYLGTWWSSELSLLLLAWPPLSQHFAPPPPLPQDNCQMGSVGQIMSNTHTDTYTHYPGTHTCTQILRRSPDICIPARTNTVDLTWHTHTNTHLSTACRMCLIHAFLSSLVVVWTSYISGPTEEAEIRNIPLSSLATSLTMSFCRGITGGFWSCKSG